MFCSFARLIVLWLSPKVLTLGKNQTSLFFRSLNRTLAVAEGTHVRKKSNKFVFSLA